MRGAFRACIARAAVGTVLLGLFAGCAATPQAAPAPAKPQSHNRAESCTGDLLLIDAAGTPRRPDPRAVESARQCTVAVRAHRSVTTEELAGANFAAQDSAEPAGQMLVEGTGVTIDRGGLVLTNQHVVEAATELSVWTPDTGWLPARVIGEDRQSDLAVIQVAGRLPVAARWGNPEALSIGAGVHAFGYSPGALLESGPEALRGQVTALHRSLQHRLDPTQDRYYGDLLESTVPLAPGHSGGPLLDERGAVVGINTACVTHTRTGQRTGYAIRASDRIRAVITALAQGQPVRHGFLGVVVCAGSRGNVGVPVEMVVPGGPAHEAGLQPHDLIVAWANRPVRNAAELAERVRAGLTEPLHQMTVLRDGQSLTLTCQLCPRPSLR